MNASGRMKMKGGRDKMKGGRRGGVGSLKTKTKDDDGRQREDAQLGVSSLGD